MFWSFRGTPPSGFGVFSFGTLPLRPLFEFFFFPLQPSAVIDVFSFQPLGWLVLALSRFLGLFVGVFALAGFGNVAQSSFVLALGNLFEVGACSFSLIPGLEQFFAARFFPDPSEKRFLT